MLFKLSSIAVTVLALVGCASGTGEEATGTTEDGVAACSIATFSALQSQVEVTWNAVTRDVRPSRRKAASRSRPRS